MKTFQFKLTMAEKVSAVHRTVLETALSTVSEIQTEPVRSIDPNTVILAFKLIATGATAASALAKLAQELIKWRRLLRETGEKPNAKLEFATAVTLDLSRATDTEIEKWLQQLNRQD